VQFENECSAGGVTAAEIAVGELAAMDARLGRREELEALLSETAGTDQRLFAASSDRPRHSAYEPEEVPAPIDKHCETLQDPPQ